MNVIDTELFSYLEKNSIEFFSPINTFELVSFRVGGKGKIVIYPSNISQLCDIISIVKDQKFILLGRGTNCYFSSSYFDGVIVVTSKLCNIEVEDEVITSECGSLINSVCKKALEYDLSGFEFAFGIPGTIGGGVNMNASAFGGSFSDILLSSTVLDMRSGKILEINSENHFFDVKKSIFKNEPLCLLKSRFKLKHGEGNEIKSKMYDFLQKRASSQPLNLPNAGSTFVKPKNAHASYLVDKAGLKGYTVGGAQVSTKHAGFIVNVGNATSNDVRELIGHIRNEVFKKFSIKLEEEIIYLE